MSTVELINAILGLLLMLPGIFFAARVKQKLFQQIERIGDGVHRLDRKFDEIHVGQALPAPYRSLPAGMELDPAKIRNDVILVDPAERKRARDVYRAALALSRAVEHYPNNSITFIQEMNKQLKKDLKALSECASGGYYE